MSYLWSSVSFRDSTNLLPCSNGWNLPAFNWATWIHRDIEVTVLRAIRSVAKQSSMFCWIKGDPGGKGSKSAPLLRRMKSPCPTFCFAIETPGLRVLVPWRSQTTLRGHELLPRMALSSLFVVSYGSLTIAKVSPEIECTRIWIHDAALRPGSWGQFLLHPEDPALQMQGLKLFSSLIPEIETYDMHRVKSKI